MNFLTLLLKMEENIAKEYDKAILEWYAENKVMP